MSNFEKDYMDGWAHMMNEARVQARVDFDEFGYWIDRYPSNTLLRGVYENAFAEAYAKAQCDDAIWSDPDA